MPVLSAQACGNGYTNAATIEDVYPVPNAGGWFALENNGNEAAVQLAYGPEHGEAVWSDEQHLGAGAFGTIPPNATGIRFRNWVAGRTAVIDCFLGRKNEPALGISSLGTINVSGASINFQRNEVAVATEPTLDFKDAANVLTFSVVDDGANTRVTVSATFPDPVVFPGSAGWGGKASNAVGTGPGGYLDSTGRVLVVRSANSSPTIGVGLTTDTNWRFQVDANGMHEWGPGNAAQDTTLARTAANTLQLGTTGQGGRLAVRTAAAGNSAHQVLVTTDANPRWEVLGSGQMDWGPGSAAIDLSLARSVTGPPSSTGGPFLATAQAFLVTSATGYVAASAANNQVFGSYLSAGDAQPAFKIFSQGALAWGPGGASALDLELARVVSSPTGIGTFLELINGDGLGYGTGTGGAVTQITSFSTGVTLNKPSGKITLFTSAISAGLLISFTVTCSPCGIDDTVVLSGDNMAGVVMSASVAAGSFVITWFSSGALASATRKINYAIIKGAVA